MQIIRLCASVIPCRNRAMSMSLTPAIAIDWYSPPGWADARAAKSNTRSLPQTLRSVFSVNASCPSRAALLTLGEGARLDRAGCEADHVVPVLERIPEYRRSRHIGTARSPRQAIPVAPRELSLLMSTLLAVAGIVVSLIALAVSIIMWYHVAPRRLLVYWLDHDTALPQDPAALNREVTRLRLTIGGDLPPHRLHVAGFRMASRGRLDIRPNDFSESRPLVFDLGASIVQVIKRDMGGQAMPKLDTSIDGSQLTFRPGWIRSDQAVSMELLTTGRVTLRCLDPPLFDVRVTQLASESKAWAKWTGPIVFAMYVLVFLGILVFLRGYFEQAISVMIVGPCMIVSAFVLLVVSAATQARVRSYQTRGLSARDARTRTRT
jgi:hypothetical protein